jgi:hypothetical protein
MAVVTITVTQMAAKYPTLPPTALSLNLGTGTSMTTVADGVSFPLTGKEIVFVLGGAASHVLTVKSVVDQFGRTGDIVYTLGIGLYCVLPQIQPAGFKQADGTCNIISDAGGTDVKFFVIRLTD